jgi:hypothetical protein
MVSFDLLVGFSIRSLELAHTQTPSAHRVKLFLFKSVIFLRIIAQTRLNSGRKRHKKAVSKSETALKREGSGRSEG